MGLPRAHLLQKDALRADSHEKKIMLNKVIAIKGQSFSFQIS